MFLSFLGNRCIQTRSSDYFSSYLVNSRDTRKKESFIRTHNVCVCVLCITAILHFHRSLSWLMTHIHINYPCFNLHFCLLNSKSLLKWAENLGFVHTIFELINQYAADMYSTLVWRAMYGVSCIWRLLLSHHFIMMTWILASKKEN